MSNITVTNKSPGDQHTAAELNQQTGFINQPTKTGTTFTDTGAITVDETVEYSTIRTVTGSTHTLTAATSGNVQGNYKKARYTFNVDCTLTLTDFDNTGSTVGTVNPIPAGTYDLWFFTTPFGVALLIQNNTGTTPATLDTPTLVLSVGNGQLGYTITGIDSNATAGVLEYSTDNTNWTTWGSYSFGTETGNITGLTNGVLYYVRYRNSASGYNPSNYATDTETPASGVTQLTQPTGLAATAQGYGITLDYDAIDVNADSVSIQRSLSSGSGFTTINTISRALTTYEDITGVIGTLYYYRIIANGSGSYSSSDPSAEASDTFPTFTNTHSMIIDDAEGCYSTDNRFLYSDGAGTDLPNTVFAWVKLDALGSAKNMVLAYDDTYTKWALSKTGLNEIYFRLYTDASNFIGQTTDVNAINDLNWHFIAVSYDASKTSAGVKIYIDGVLANDSADETGTYTGIPAISTNFRLEVPRANVTGNSIYNMVRIYGEELTGVKILNQNNSGVPKGDDPTSFDIDIELRFNQNTDSSYGATTTQIGTPTYSTDIPT